MQSFDCFGEARDDLEDVETVLNNAPDDSEGAPDAGDRDSLNYSAGTGTLGATSLNFGFSASKGFFRNDPRLQAAVLQHRQQEELRE